MMVQNNRSKGGRLSQDKTIVHYTIDRKISNSIRSLPDGDRSRFVNNILIQGLERILKEGLESFLASPDFKEAVESASIASWKGDEVRVEILLDGSWRKIYYSHGEFASMKYDFPGAIILIPPVDCAEMPQFIEDGGTQQEWFTLAFANERDEIEKGLRQGLKQE
jgi:hypothetical protein